MPGGYGATSSALTRPTACSTATLSRGAKKASRGLVTVTGSTAQTPGGDDRPGAAPVPLDRLHQGHGEVDSPSGVSARVTIATTVSRSAISTGIPRASRSASTALPSAPVPGSTRVSRIGSTPGPSSTTRPGTRASRSRTVATASMTGPSRASPSRSSRARAASMLARMAPDGLVVAVASTAASNRARPIRRLRASTSAPCDQAGRALWALVTRASAPGGERVRRQGGVEPEVGAPRGIDDERDAVPVRHRGQAAHVADRADVGRVADEDGPGVGRLGEGGLEGRGRDTDREPVGGVDLRPEPDRFEAGQHQPEEHRAVQGAGHDDPVARAGRRRAPGPGCRASSRRPRTGRGRLPTAAAARGSASATTPRASFIVSRPA